MSIFRVCLIVGISASIIFVAYMMNVSSFWFWVLCILGVGLSFFAIRRVLKVAPPKDEVKEVKSTVSRVGESDIGLIANLRNLDPDVAYRVLKIHEDFFTDREDLLILSGGQSSRSIMVQLRRDKDVDRYQSSESLEGPITLYGIMKISLWNNDRPNPYIYDELKFLVPEKFMVWGHCIDGQIPIPVYGHNYRKK